MIISKVYSIIVKTTYTATLIKKINHTIAFCVAVTPICNTIEANQTGIHVLDTAIRLN